MKMAVEVLEKPLENWQTKKIKNKKSQYLNGL
jgi:hypothetical protein